MKKILFLLFILLNLNADSIKWDENLTKGKLKNGFEYYIKSNPNPPKTAFFYLIVNAGSIDENENELGIAHFVEHMAFNGTADFDKNDMIKELESLGVRFGADLNAMTSYNQTIYNLQIPVNDDNIKKAFKIFDNWADKIKFENEEIKKESGVIIEEERLRDTPYYRLYLDQLNMYYGDTLYTKRLPIGDMKIVQNADHDLLKGFYNRTYRPNAMKLIIVGDIDEKQMLNMTKETFEDNINPSTYERDNIQIPIKAGFKTYRYNTKLLGNNEISLNFVGKYIGQSDELSIRKQLINSYISRLLSMIYEKKNINAKIPYQASFSSYSIERQKTYFSFNSNVINEDFNATLGDMLNVIKGIEKFGFNTDDFEVAKKDFLESAKLNFERAKTKKSDEILRYYLVSLVDDEIIRSDFDIFELSKKLLNEISLDEINSYFKEILALETKNFVVYSKNDLKFSTADFEQISAKVVPYMTSQNSILPKTLLENEPSPRKIISKNIDEKNQIYTYTFENNATAILKPMHDRKNQILFSAVSKGGISNLAKPKEGPYAVKLANDSGVGRFSNYELSKILSGKNISYDRKIDQFSQGIYGKSSSEDINSLFEAVYLEFTSPRLDVNKLSQIKIKRLNQLENDEKTPEFKFTSQMMKFLFGNNPRKNAITKAEIEALKLENLQKIINDKFKNANDYTFVLVGDFDIAKIEPLLEKYVATLPSDEKSENFVDDGVRMQDGEQKFDANFVTNDKSEVTLIMKNDNATYSRLDELKAEALGSVLSVILREKIREDNGDTYGISAHIKLDKIPYSHSVGQIGFACNPKNAQKIIAQIREVIEKFDEFDIDIYLENYKKSALVTMERNAKQPEFWSQNIIDTTLFGDELFDMQKYTSEINSISSADVKNMAKILLNNGNFIQIINNPHK